MASSTNLRHPSHSRLWLFRAPNGKSENWYCGYHHKGRFLRKSTGTALWSDALRIAEDWYLELLHGIRSNRVVVIGRPLSSFVAGTLKNMAHRNRSPRYIEAIRRNLAADYYPMRFFGPKRPAEVTSRSWDDFRAWLREIRVSEKKPMLSERTLHQLKNSVMLLRKQVYIERQTDQLPEPFADIQRDRREDSRPRVFFNPDEYAQLKKALQDNIRRHQSAKTRWVSDAQELYDFVLFMVHTGLRVGECLSLRARDVEVRRVTSSRRTREVCFITVASGKRGAHGQCVSYYGAAAPFRRACERRGISQPNRSEEVVFAHNHRDAFKRLLQDNDLRFDSYNRKRDFVSLRHTYICFRLGAGVPVFDVAVNTRTSVAMIEKHYAKSLDPVVRSLNRSTWGATGI